MPERRRLPLFAGAALGLTAFGGLAGLEVMFFDPATLPWAGLGAMTSLVVAFECGRKLRRLRALAFKLSSVQRGGVYEVEVTLNPAATLRLTAVNVQLECVQTEQLPLVDPNLQQGDEEEVLFTVAETLFEGALTLGHGEKFARTAELELPAVLRRKTGPEFSIHCQLKVRVDVDGVSYLEHAERVQVTLSQM